MGTARNTRLIWGGLAMAVSLSVGCGESPTEPSVFGGAGIRVSLPEETENLAWIRVELWNDNLTPPRYCVMALSGASRTRVFPEAQPPDICTRMDIRIFDYAQQLVRFMPEEPVFGDVRNFGWDRLDDQGEPVTSGYYPVTAECVDSQGSLTFEGHYFNWEEREKGECEWPLWIEEMEPPPSSRSLSFGPFLVVAEHQIYDVYGEPVGLANFQNPYLVRVKAPGMQTFETEITLVDEKFANVSVTFVPTP